METLQDSIRLRNQATIFALSAAICLTFLKLTIGHFTGSVSVFSDGIHSVFDLFSATVAFFTVRKAGKPADKQHPYGHGKFETLSGLFEAFLLVLAAIWIIFEAIKSLQTLRSIAHDEIAIATAGISILTSLGVYKYNSIAAEKLDSSALRVNAIHFLSDVLTSLAIFIGLIVVHFTGEVWVDSVLALGVAGYVLWIAYGQMKVTVAELVDEQLPKKEIERIKTILSPFKKRIIGIHNFRTRKSGANRQIDFHLVVCKNFTVEESHNICDEMEKKLHKDFVDPTVIIHVEPCSHEEIDCSKNCYYQTRIKGGVEEGEITEVLRREWND